MPRKSYDPLALPWGAGSIEQRGAKFYARWREKGELQARQFPSKETAHAFLLTQWQKRQAGQFVDASRLTVQILVEQSIDRKVHLAPSTRRLYRQIAKGGIYPLIGDVLVQSMSRYRVQHWIDSLLREGRSANYIHLSKVVLFDALRHAHDIGILSEDITTRITAPTSQIKAKETWTVDQVRTLLTHVASDPMLNALYWMALTTAVRPGELLVLQWRDIDWQEGTATIWRTYTTDERGRAIVGTTTKGKRSRVVTIPQEALEALAGWRTEQKVIELPGWLWVNSQGGPLSPTAFARRHRAICKAAGIPYRTPHASRHTAATLMMGSGTNPKVVREILGHKNVQTTLAYYMHVDPDMTRSATDELGKKLG